MEKSSQPEITLFAYYDHKTSFASEKSSFDCYVLIAVKNGSFAYQIGDGDRHIASENCIVVFPPSTPIFREILEPSSLIVAQLSTQALCNFPQEPLAFPENRRVQENISALSQNSFAYTHQPNAETSHYIFDLWYIATQTLEKKSAPLQSVYDYLCKHFCEEISIQELAKSYGYTPPRLIAIFNKHYGAPPKNIILQKRILKAQQLLLQTDLSIGEISLQCGYGDNLYFSRIFSKYCGTSPAQFRKEQSI